jgi:5-methylcytosine-specific restriction endonuclease McrA
MSHRGPAESGEGGSTRIASSQAGAGTPLGSPKGRISTSPAWRLARSEQLAREPNCRLSGAKASAVDHIVSIAEGGADLDLANLRSLCKRHHGRKSLDESHRGMKRAAQRRRKQ